MLTQVWPVVSIFETSYIGASLTAYLLLVVVMYMKKAERPDILVFFVIQLVLFISLL